MTKKKTLEKVFRLHKLFHEGKIPTLAQHEVNPELNKGSRENYLYFTLPPSINFQRNSPAMWASALKTYTDPETNYLFSPEKVVKHSRNSIQKDLIKYRLALQTNKHTDIWIKISETLAKYYSGDPREVLKEAKYNVIEILENLQNVKKSLFPYLGGKKLSNYWLFILNKFTDVKLKNVAMLSVIPDTHVLQSTVKLGLHNGAVTAEIADKLWRDLLVGTDLYPVDMHPVLWNWSRNNFQPEV